MIRRPEIFSFVAVMLFGTMWLPAAARGEPVQAGSVVARQVDYRAQMEREAAAYVRAGQRALKRGQLNQARAWFLKARNLFPGHKGANTGLRQVRAAQARHDRLYFTNSIGMKFRLIPAGSFMMGSPTTERGRYSDEGPQHQVIISRPFFMQTTEVTQAQYRKIMGANPSHFQGCDQCPVDRVSWTEAQEFIRRLNAREKTNKYRLPTEAEWEYACRAGTTTPFCSGQTISTDRANYDGRYVYGSGRKGEYRQKTTPVGTFPPTRWGLYDMHGNVAEWCGDWYGKDYYKSNTARDPKGPSSGNFRVLRGGSWSDDPRYLRSASRYWRLPWYHDVHLGFRVLRTY